MSVNKLTPYLGIVTAVIGLAGFLTYKHETDLEQIKTAYISEKQRETEAIAVKVENTFKSLYQGLRTMALLPGVRDIDRYGTNFEANSKKVMQQIYNNTYLNVTLSEVYVLPSTLDPEKIDLNTGKTEQPILTFDEFIVGGAATNDSTDQQPSEKLEEVESYEYRLMKTQLEYLSTHYSTQSTFKNLDFPAVTGEPVITCDNSEFTQKDLESGNNKPRMGVVYTLPVYDNDGRLKGGVSGIVRLSVLESLIPKGTHAIVNRPNKYLGAVEPIKELDAATASFSQGTTDPNLIYSDVRKLNVVDSSPWELWVALPNGEFESLSSVHQTNFIFYSGILISLILGLGLAAGVRSSQSYQARLEAKVQEKTQELSARNAAMGLILDNAQEGFLTCSLAGEIGSEYSKVVEKWFGVPEKNARIDHYLYPEDTKKRQFFECGWSQLVDDFLPFEISAGQLPATIKHGDSHYSLTYTPILATDGKLGRVLVVLSDVSAKMEAERRDREQREILAVFQALSKDRSGFLEFFADSEAAVRELKNTDMAKDIQFRIIHTLKGNSAQYGLATVAELCHALESELQEESESLAKERIDLLAETWNETSLRLLALMGDRNRKRIELEEAEYLDVLQKLKAGARHEDITVSIQRWRLEPAAKRLERMAENARRLGERLGFASLDVTVNDNGIRLEPESFPDFWSAMIHVVRNAVDHGFENATTLKPAISLTTELIGEMLVVEVKDNGKGIDWDRIRQKAVKLGIPCTTTSDLESCIFADGFTTKDAVTSVSGRGVGMAAVQSSVLRYGGKIEIRTEKNQGTTFRFFLPGYQKGTQNKAAA